MELNRVRYFFLRGEDRPGFVAQLSEFLKERSIDLECLWGLGLGMGTAQVYLVPRDPELFEKEVSSMPWRFASGTCFRVVAEDNVGALSGFLSQLADAGINLQGMNAVGNSGEVGCYVWPKEDDISRVEELIKKSA